MTNYAFEYLLRNVSRSHPGSGSYIARVHDSILRRTLRGEKYLKLYSYHYLINGFSILVTPQQVYYQLVFVVIIHYNVVMMIMLVKARMMLSLLDSFLFPFFFLFFIFFGNVLKVRFNIFYCYFCFIHCIVAH